MNSCRLWEILNSSEILGRHGRVNKLILQKIKCFLYCFKWYCSQAGICQRSPYIHVNFWSRMSEYFPWYFVKYASHRTRIVMVWKNNFVSSSKKIHFSPNPFSPSIFPTKKWVYGWNKKVCPHRWWLNDWISR